MKALKITSLLLIVSIALGFSLCCHAGEAEKDAKKEAVKDVTKDTKPVKLDTFLKELTDPSLTNLQKLDLAEKYKDRPVEGKARVKDVIPLYGAENQALVYMEAKLWRGKYEITLVIDQENADKIVKLGMLAFCGKFAGMSYDTFRFENGKLL
jgi:hypothetical protein